MTTELKSETLIKLVNSIIVRRDKTNLEVPEKLIIMDYTIN